ncbi:di-trans,poly-cis-decaprenylcistransferase [Candidatus Woesearchaeota archaeon]|jgi:tritrans,polycis-undecaprenyl-diphosphate synthase [geranylgeranyl-diphosphate specific]|nr:di-trans,poly-cis-decaprenylcistransferase [Candidatus Woesearchaeota archaeon]MDP6648452.1 polyprenyl diphosphate synthase [Candidatus Woesearchaeota archaeon]|tara:strand:- start:41079 stop:41780 length:702 start_codon:yes stop_codon:yes gene_type:complete
MVSKVPRHIAIILDGNRRYAKRLGLQPWKGHEYGIKKLEELLVWCQEIGIKELTLYSFSTENFKRSKTEIDFLFNLFKQKFRNMSHSGTFDKGIRVNVIGRLEMFPEGIRNAMLDIMEKTKNNDKLTVNFAMAYGGRQEITDSVKKIAENVKKGKLNANDIDENLIASNLYLKSEPDLVIRPGGEIRTSNFLTWQSTYSEWIFLKDKLWPEFTKEDLLKCIEEFNTRERRFGS